LITRFTDLSVGVPSTSTDGDQAQVDMEANHQEQEEVEAQVEDAHGGQSPPQRLTKKHVQSFRS